MAYTRAVAVVLGTLLALIQTEVEAGVAHAQVFSSGSGYNSGAAQSEVRESDGTIKGECAYLDSQGNSIKIKYTQSPNGHVEAIADPPMQNPTGALENCRRSADAAAKTAHESFQQTQEQIFRQQQELQQEIFNQNQAIHQAFQFPKFFGIPPQFPFGPNF